jgi:hypothetical protein
MESRHYFTGMAIAHFVFPQGCHRHGLREALHWLGKAGGHDHQPV